VHYAYPWDHAIKAFKFHANPGWAKPLATLLRSTPWIEPALDAADWVIPIPLSRQRLQERGFNQAILIAQRLSPHKLKTQVLLRLHDTEAQSSLPRAQRLRNLRHAFMVEPAHASLLQGRRILLLDDVMTTGATLNAAAAALRASGAAHITGVVVARTEREGSQPSAPPAH
jgi:ComF family protein